jgi:hypothetical protein
VLAFRCMKLLQSLVLALIFVCGALPRIEVNGPSGGLHSQKAPTAINAHRSALQFRASRRTNPVQLGLLSIGHWSRVLRAVGSQSLDRLEAAAPSNRILLALLCYLRI